MAEGFRIQRIFVEGFKGFTHPQQVDLRNRHAFLIGPNGNGKSSIIEAIRWGLFGSSNRPNDTIRNEGYVGDCRVEMDMSRDGKAWRLRRILIPGSGDSRAQLVDEGGKEHRISDVLPQLDSANAGEGTHIIFAAQSAPLGRQPEDLTPFERTVIRHLGLTDARAMLSHLETFVKEQEDEEAILATRVDERRGQLTDRIAALERRRDLILAAPPWEGDLQPSIADTESMTKALIREIATSQAEKDFAQLSLDVLVDEAERALQERIDLARTPLAEQLEGVDDELSRLEGIRAAWEGTVRKRRELRTADEDLERILAGNSLGELEGQVQRRRQEAGTLALRRRLGETATELLERTVDEGVIPCPVCETGRERDELRRLILAVVDSASDEDPSALRETENQLKEAQEADSLVQELGQEIETAERELDATIAAEENQELRAAVSGGYVGDYIESVEKQKGSVQEQLDDFEVWLERVQARLEKLREEARFQQLQRDLIASKAVEADMRLAEQSFEQFVRFGESVRDIFDSVRSTLTEELRKKIPSVAEELTTVFSALTEHPHFDRLVIDEKRLPKLELLVASSSDPSGTLHPTGVLNGQAESALALVPYFALSQAHEAPTEVYLVLLDDPTRAFDKDHIQILIERLADLGKRVQIVVATQETEAFRELLPKSFKRDSYVVVEPKNWSYADGPKLVAQYGTS